MQLPSVCSNGHFYEGSIVQVGGSVRGLVIQDVGARPCPICGASGMTIEGTYNLVDGALEIAALADYSSDVLLRVLEVARKPDVSTKDLEEELPGLADWLRLNAPIISMGTGGIALLVAVLSFLVNVFGGAAPQASPDELRDAVREGIVQGLGDVRSAPMGRPVDDADHNNRGARPAPKVPGQKDQADRKREDRKRKAKQVRAARRRNR